ncbi:MAG: LCP family protein [Oscillospiraceae bacterium]|nr:LCP family protein [Oscillospiraceae bacterium]
MKLVGNSRHGKHVDSGAAVRRAPYQAAKKKTSAAKVLVIILIVLACIAAVLFALYKMGVKPPSVNMIRRPGSSGSASADQSGRDPEAPSAAVRNGSKYTFLVMGTDQANSNTDTIMVATFDTENYSMDVVSIPRDTLVNVPWYVKKVNSLYGSVGIEGTIEHLADILGYEVDHYAIVDLDAFQILVDAIGGVYYDVPVDMDYEDQYQDLYIHIPAGEQWLDGAHAVQVMRFRSGYENADIGRIATQQDFMMTMIYQILERRDDITIPDMVELAVKHVVTDMSYGNMIWFVQEFYKVDAENVSFTTMPGNYYDMVDEISFVSIKVGEWLELVNNRLNPFDEPVTLDDVSILTRDGDGYLYSTNGYYAGDPSWGSDSVHYPEEDAVTDAIIYYGEPSQEPSPSHDPEPVRSEEPVYYEPEPTEEPWYEPEPTEEPVDEEPEPTEGSDWESDWESSEETVDEGSGEESSWEETEEQVP